MSISSIRNIKKTIDSWSYSKWLLVGFARSLKKVARNPIDYSPIILLIFALIYVWVDEDPADILIVLSGISVILLNPVVLLDILLLLRDFLLPYLYLE